MSGRLEGINVARILWISKASVTASYRSKLVAVQTLRPDFEVGLVVGQRWGPVEYEARESDRAYPIFRLSQVLSGRNHFHWYQGVGRVIRDFRPDILHVDEEHYSVVTAQAMAWGRRYRVPYMIFQTWQNIYKRYPWPFLGIERFVFRSSDLALAGTEEIKAVLMRKGFMKPVVVVPLGTDTDTFYPRDQQAAKGEFGLTGYYAVGYVGRMVQEKGLGDLFKAVIPLLKSYPMLCLVLAGSGPLTDSLKQQAKDAGIEGRVRWIPWLSSEVMPRLMAALDVLVVPSRTTLRWKEQFGRVITEAMAVGTPVIGSDSGEIPRVIGQAGKIFPEGQVDGLKQQIESLYRHPEMSRDLRAKGLERVHALYTQHAVARRLIDVYDRLLSGARPKAETN